MLTGARTLVTAALPELAGRPGLTQGAYGDAGNLELVVPAADRGFWVFWFNADQVERQQGAAVGHWSGGLHVDTGAAVTAACITQVRAGPRFLEVVVAAGGGLHRRHWAPESGFVDDGALAPDICSATAMTEAADSSLHVLAIDSGGHLVHLHSTGVGYPAVRWRRRRVHLDDDVTAPGAHIAPGTLGAARVSLARDRFGALVGAVLTARGLRIVRFDGAWRPVPAPDGSWTDVALVESAPMALVGLDGRGRLCATTMADTKWAPPVALDAGGPWRAVTASATTLDGGRVDVVLVGDDALWHAHGTFESFPWPAAEPVRSRIWAVPGGPVHRR